MTCTVMVITEATGQVTMVDSTEDTGLTTATTAATGPITAASIIIPTIPTAKTTTADLYTEGGTDRATTPVPGTTG